MAMLLGAAATAISSYVGMGVRLLIPPVMLAIQIVILWVADRGPVFHPTSGGIVRFLYILMLATAVVLVVSVPIFSVWLRRWAPPCRRRVRGTQVTATPGHANWVRLASPASTALQQVGDSNLSVDFEQVAFWVPEEQHAVAPMRATPPERERSAHGVALALGSSRRSSKAEPERQAEPMPILPGGVRLRSRLARIRIRSDRIDEPTRKSTQFSRSTSIGNRMTSR